MPEQLGQLSSSFRRIFSGFTSGQKAVTFFAVIAILLGGYAFTSWAAKPSMVPLFTNLASADAAAITETLSGKGTKYELEAGGSTVMVPQKDVYQLRLDLSAEGLPQDGTTGYELLDKQGITTSEFRQRVDYQRALEGELSKTITSIDGVQATTVHLVIPEENLFADEAREPSASVLIKNKPGQKMDIGKVQAVVKLVASSVEGLEQERVTVADSKGLVLSAPGEDGATVAAGDVRAVQTATFEQNLQTSVEQMLAPLVGDGKAVVRVRAVLDFDKRSTKTESFETDKKAPVVLEKTGKEAYTGAGQTVGGVLGPENVELPEGAGETKYDKDQNERQYAVGKTTEEAVAAPGTVQRLSVAVVLDNAADPAITTGAVKQLVVAAAGLDTERGDVVEVNRLAFDTTASSSAEKEFAALEKATKAEQRWSLIRTGVVLLVVVLIVLYALRTLRRTSSSRTVVDLPVLDLEARQLSALESEHAAMLAAADRLALESAAVTPEDARRMAVQAEVGELVERQPEEVAQLLRGWLADRRN
jgi:flagellar M-ring protein FliF